MPSTKDKPRIRQRTKPTTQTKHEDLATLISKVLNHPQLPHKLEQCFGEGMCDLFNDLSSEQKSRIENDPAHIAHLLAVTAENEKGDARK